MRNSTSSNSLATFPSPGSPHFVDSNAGMTLTKGWSSERVAIPVNRPKRQTSFPGFIPFSSGRTFPSKWEDAERWITSPLSLESSNKICNSSCETRRVQSKSGPIGYYWSGSSQGFEGGQNVRRNSMMLPITSSAFSSGLVLADNTVDHYGDALPAKTEKDNSAFRLSQFSDFRSQSSLPSSEDEKFEVSIINITDGENTASRVTSRRDMATQMSPDGGSKGLSSKDCSLSSYRFPPSPDEHCSNHSNNGKSDVKDVEVDKWGTVFKWSKRLSRRDPPCDEYLENNSSQSGAFSWDITESAKQYKFERDEAKIAAWENLQKAKAEAAINKLEMKLEKRRASLMDKILKKLERAEMKAQEMRRTLNDESRQGRDLPNPNASHNLVPLKKNKYLRAFLWCFNCQPI